MGQISAARCRMCQGRGNIALGNLPEVILHEWMEGYLDKDTDDAWLEDNLQKLIRVRKQIRAKELAPDGSSLDEQEEDDI